MNPAAIITEKADLLDKVEQHKIHVTPSEPRGWLASIEVEGREGRSRFIHGMGDNPPAAIKRVLEIYKTA